MRFVVERAVFAKLPSVCFGVVVARGMVNGGAQGEIDHLLAAAIGNVREKTAACKAKELPEIQPYREAFVALGINPNKFPSSIEAMAARIEKKKEFPRINPVVDLGNAISLQYLLPLGAHDMDSAAGDICVRFSQSGDRFVPFGETQAEDLPPGELIYAVGEKVKTRRWIWRQSEVGKVTEHSRNVFFPLDGFVDRNRAQIIAARDRLAHCLTEYFHCEVKVGYVDTDCREIIL